MPPRVKTERSNAPSEAAVQNSSDEEANDAGLKIINLIMVTPLL